MPLWDIVRVDPKTRREKRLGRVRAANSAAACLRGFEKFGISDNADQRRIAARPVAAVKASTPVPEEERKDLRKISAAFIGALRGFARPR